MVIFGGYVLVNDGAKTLVLESYKGGWSVGTTACTQSPLNPVVIQLSMLNPRSVGLFSETDCEEKSHEDCYMELQSQAQG